MGWFKKFAAGAGASAILPSLGLTAVDAGMGMVNSKYAADQQSKLNREQFGMQQGENLAAFERNKAWDLEKFNLEKDLSIDMWNRQNEYNSPVNQMARMKEAGLNPNLMYDMGSPGNATVINTPSIDDSNIEPAMAGRVDYEKPETPNIAEKLLSYMQIQNKGLENQNLSATNSLIAQNTRKAGLDADLAEYELGLARKSGISIRDPWYMRMGGRVGNWFGRNKRDAHEFFNDEKGPFHKDYWNGKEVKVER